jgi:VCBS repeat-containing protein
MDRRSRSVLLGLAACLLCLSPAFAAVFTSTDVPKAIPTGPYNPFTEMYPPVNSQLTIAQSGVVAKVTVTLNINYQFAYGLKVWLWSPGGAFTILTANAGPMDGGANFTNTVFDDAAAVYIGDGSAPFTGTFRPLSPLSDFVGQSLSGTWTLRAASLYSGYPGTINSWSLNITTDNVPVAVDDPSYSVHAGRTLTVDAPGVLANDTDADNDTLSVASGSRGSNLATPHGHVTLNANGSFSYTPTPGYAGNDTFTYKCNDGIADSGNSATVTIAVNDQAPTAAGDSYTAFANVALNIPAATGVLANDSDADAGDSLTASLTVEPLHGALTLNADGSFSYTAVPGYSGTDTFKYKASDGTELSNEATVTLTVHSTAPVVLTLNPATNRLWLGNQSVTASGWYAPYANDAARFYVTMAATSASVWGSVTQYDIDGAGPAAPTTLPTANRLTFAWAKRSLLGPQISMQSQVGSTMTSGLYLQKVGTTVVGTHAYRGAWKIGHAVTPSGTVTVQVVPLAP